MTDGAEAPKAYSYIRMSTPEQQRGDSMRRQLRASEQFATDNGLELAEIIQDIGVSAFHGRNAEMGSLARFLTAVDQGLVQPGCFLLVESLDRLSRENIPQALTLLNGIVERGITVVTLQDRQRYSLDVIATNPTALLVAVLTMMRAHEESKVKSERLAAVWAQKKAAARTGRVTGQKLPLWLRYSADKSAIEPIPERVEVLREIFRRSVGGYGVYSICRWLNAGTVRPWGMQAAVGSLLEAIKKGASTTDAEVAVVPHGAAGLGSTLFVDFHTTKPIYAAAHSHLNAMVADSIGEAASRRGRGAVLTLTCDRNGADSLYLRVDVIGVLNPVGNDRPGNASFLYKIDGQTLVKIQGEYEDGSFWNYNLKKGSSGNRFVRALESGTTLTLYLPNYRGEVIPRQVSLENAGPSIAQAAKSCGAEY